ncbi:MAG: NAD(P)H-dependent oxidoreductase [Actinomycetota bacterium]
MHVLTFAATSSRRSINRRLVDHAADVLRQLHPAVEISTLDLNDFEMPIYSIDREQEDGIPQAAQDFYDRITAADALIISFAEHNGSYTAAFKNVYDWASRVDAKVYQDTPTVMLATAPGPRGGAGVLGSATMTAPFFGCDLRGQLSIPRFNDAFDTERGVLTNPETADELRTILSSLLTPASEAA